MTPVPKSGDRHSVNNYRPISIVLILAKVLESIVHDQVYEYLESNNILKTKTGAPKTYSLEPLMTGKLHLNLVMWWQQ